VDRYLGELRDLYEDALQAELAAGQSRAGAEHAAWARLGTEEDLAQSVLAPPGLRSTAARYPAIALGAGPVLLRAAIVFTTF
jgi:hypothetical protein